MIIIMRGVSGSGKDTAIAKFPELKPVVISSDEYRERFFGTRSVSPNASSMIWGEIRTGLYRRCMRGQNAIINATNVSMKSINGWTKIAYKFGHECHIVSIDVDRATLVHRLAERQNNGEFTDADPEFVTKMHDKFERHTPIVQKAFGDRFHSVSNSHEASLVISDLIQNNARRFIDGEEEKRTFIIGDVHGEVEKLDTLLNRLPWNACIYTLGDLIDRGPSSVGVLERLRYDRRWKGAIMGNHESAFLTERLDGARCKSKSRQMTHQEFDELTEDHADKLTSLMAKFSPCIRLDGASKRILLTHGGISHTSQSDLFLMAGIPMMGDHMLRVENWKPSQGDPEAVTHQVHGHSSWTYTGNFTGAVINLDSGCGKDEDDDSTGDRSLTAHNPFTGETITV